MEESTLRALLKAASDRHDNDNYYFEEKSTDLLFAASGDVIAVEKLRELRIGQGFVMAQGARESFFVPWPHIVALRQPAASRETGSGFLAGA